MLFYTLPRVGIIFHFHIIIEVYIHWYNFYVFIVCELFYIHITIQLGDDFKSQTLLSSTYIIQKVTTSQTFFQKLMLVATSYAS